MHALMRVNKKSSLLAKMNAILQAILAILAVFVPAMLVYKMIRKQAETLNAETTSTNARYVIISRDAPQLEVAEVQVYDKEGTNIAALHGTVKQSSILESDDAKYGPNTIIDGNISGLSERGEVATTRISDEAPWIELDLGAVYDLSKISIYLRDRDSHPNPSSQWFRKHNKNIKIEILDRDRKIMWTQTIVTWQRLYDFPIKINKE